MISRNCSVVFCGLLFTPGLAVAHMPIKGINNFYNGLIHPVLVPSHLLLLIAMGLFFGQQGPKENQKALVVFLIATIVGLIVAWFSIGVDMEMFLLSGSAAIGLLVAISPAAGLFWCSIIVALVGLSVGMDSAQETLSGKEKFLSLFGSGVGIYLLFLYPMAFADYFNKKTWQKIGVRVVGSWVAASSLLVLALSLSTRP